MVLVPQQPSVFQIAIFSYSGHAPHTIYARNLLKFVVENSFSQNAILVECYRAHQNDLPFLHTRVNLSVVASNIYNRLRNCFVSSFLKVSQMSLQMTVVKRFLLQTNWQGLHASDAFWQNGQIRVAIDA